MLSWKLTSVWHVIGYWQFSKSKDCPWGRAMNDKQLRQDEIDTGNISTDRRSSARGINITSHTVVTMETKLIYRVLNYFDLTEEIKERKQVMFDLNSFILYVERSEILRLCSIFLL